MEALSHPARMGRALGKSGEALTGVANSGNQDKPWLVRGIEYGVFYRDRGGGRQEKQKQGSCFGLSGDHVKILGRDEPLYEVRKNAGS